MGVVIPEWFDLTFIEVDGLWSHYRCHLCWVFAMSLSSVHERVHTLYMMGWYLGLLRYLDDVIYDWRSHNFLCLCLCWYWDGKCVWDVCVCVWRVGGGVGGRSNRLMNGMHIDPESTWQTERVKQPCQSLSAKKKHTHTHSLSLSLSHSRSHTHTHKHL